MSAELKAKIGADATRVNVRLTTLLDELEIPQPLKDAMAYSLDAGGKRLRPLLALRFAALHGLGEAALNTAVLDFACGIEYVHTYSLVHDDLPAMDDDDMRRGKPSNHKAYGEDVAILAGDGLLTEAFGLMMRAANHLPAERVVAATADFVAAAGARGMVGGQVLDMAFTARDDVTLDELAAMHALKTGALITTSCTCGALLAGAQPDEVAHAATYGRHTGLAFQIVDDILDVVADEAELGKPVGSDEASGKATYPSLVGLDESRRMAEDAVDKALAAIARQSGPHAEFLRDLARYILQRAC